MTLSIRISTPVGLVFCSDSLITYPETIKEIDWEKSGEYIPMGAHGEGSPAYLTNPQTKDRTFVRTTVSNVSKVHRIGNIPLAYSVAGSVNFLVSNVQAGRHNNTMVPFESFSPVVDKIITDLIEKNPDVDISEICQCACHALSCGVNGVHDVNTDGWSLSILGGGYSPASPWPHVFDFDLEHKGQNKEVIVSIMDAATGAFSRSVGVCLPTNCNSVNIFSEFCENDLERCLVGATLNACVWSSFFNLDEDTFRNDVIPDTLGHLKKITLLIGRILDRWGIDGLQTYEFSDVISEMWEVRADDYRDELSSHYEDIFDNFIENNQSVISRMLECFSDRKGIRDHCDAIDSEIFSDCVLSSPPTEDEWKSVGKTRESVRGGVVSVLYDRLDAKTQTNLAHDSYFGLCRLFGVGMKEEGYIQSVGAGDLMFVDKWGEFGFSYWAPEFPYFGISHRGQSDVVQRIMEGFDRKSRRKTERAIRDYTMEAAERLGDIVQAGLEGREPPQLRSKQSGSEKSHAPPRFSLEKPEDDDGEAENDDVDEPNNNLQPHIGFGPGAWTGFYISSSESSDVDDETVRNKFSMDFTINLDGNLTGSGNSLEGKMSAEVQTDESGTTVLDVAVRGSESYKEGKKKFSVEGNLESWGFNGGFEDGEEWRSFIMWPVDNLHSEVDSVSVVQGAIRTLHSELDKFTVEADQWEIDFEYIPLETAVELAHYLMESTVKKQYFNTEVPTVGGRIKTVTISHGGEYLEF